MFTDRGGGPRPRPRPGASFSFPDGPWVLARPARTDPVVRVYAEAPGAAARDALIGAVCDSVAAGPALP